MFFFSKTTKGFYPVSLKSEYEKNGSWPADAVGGVSKTRRDEISAGELSGKMISGDENGYPILIDQPVPPLDDSISALVRQIDMDADTIYTAALGHRATEYAQSEAESQAFKDSGYAGDPPDYVRAWSDATGATAQWAADDILATAAAWRGAQTSIRVNRLACKEAARKAKNSAELNSVADQWELFVSTIQAQLGLPG